MAWRRLTDHAIAADSGHEIYRTADGRFQAWAPPGSCGQLEQSVSASLDRVWEEMGLGAGNEFEVSYKDARLCLGVFSTAEEARDACSQTP